MKIIDLVCLLSAYSCGGIYLYDLARNDWKNAAWFGFLSLFNLILTRKPKD